MLIISKFFRLKHISEIDTYQDENVWKNNSVFLIDFKIKIIIQFIEDLIIVSIDTESEKTEIVLKASDFDEIWKNEFFS